MGHTSVRIFLNSIFLCTMLILVGATKPQLSGWPKALDQFSKETRLLARTQMALTWVPQLGRMAKRGQFQNFSAEDRAVIKELRDLYRWIEKRVASVDRYITVEERIFIAGGIETSLIPQGGALLPELRNGRCTARQTKQMAKTFDLTETKLAQVMSKYTKIQLLDSMMNQKFYEQQLLKVVLGRPEIPYQSLVVQYLESKKRRRPTSQKSETIRAAQRMESAFHEHHRLKTDLILYGVRRSKRFFADLLKVSGGCRITSNTPAVPSGGRSS